MRATTARQALQRRLDRINRGQDPDGARLLPIFRGREPLHLEHVSLVFDRRWVAVRELREAVSVATFEARMAALAQQLAAAPAGEHMTILKQELASTRQRVTAHTEDIKASRAKIQLINLVLAVGANLVRPCALPTCGQWFVATRKQRYDTLRHAADDRNRKRRTPRPRVEVRAS